MTYSEFVKFLKTVSDEQEVVFEYTSIPTVHLRNIPYADIKKHATIRGRINFSYASEIAAESPGYTPGPRVWGQRLQKTPLVEHKGILYLEVIVAEKTSEYYTSEGNVLTEEQIKPHLKDTAPTNYSLVRPRDFKVSGIPRFVLAGKEYKIE